MIAPYLSYPSLFNHPIINFEVVVCSPHQSPRCGVSRFQSAQSIAIPMSVWSSFDIAVTLKQKVGVALPASAAPPPKGDLTSRESLEVLAADSVGR